MTGRLRLDPCWTDPPDAELAFGPERSTWAALTIRLGGLDVTAHRSAEAGEGTSVVGGMSGLAEWLVDNWVYILWDIHPPFPKFRSALFDETSWVPSLADAWEGWERFSSLKVDRRALGSWQHRHTLGHATSDLALPSISFLPEDKRVGVAIGATPVPFDPGVRFAILERPLHAPVWVAKDDLEDELRAFVTATVNRARATGQDDEKHWATWLGERFAAAEREAHDTTVRTRLMFGEFVANRWPEAQHALGADADALRGILLDASHVLDDTTFERLQALVEAVVKETSSKGLSVQPEWKAVREHADFAGPPHERGYRLAERVRSLLDEPDAPLTDMAQALERFDVKLEPWRAEGNLFRSAVIAADQGSARIVYSRGNGIHSGVAPTRFAIAAAFGRLLYGASRRTGAFGAAHGAQSRWLQTRVANAFAAELLLPSAALYLGHDLQVLCEEYGISRSAAEWHRSNRHVESV
jgi:hypothetical protein